MLTSRRTIDVEWGDCDPAGIVSYQRYFAWFDESTVQNFAAAGLPIRELIRRYKVVGMPVVDVKAKFHVPSDPGDEIVIESRISRFGKSSFDIEHHLFRGDDLAVEGIEKRVLVARSEGDRALKSTEIPAEVISIFSNVRDSNPGGS